MTARATHNPMYPRTAAGDSHRRDIIMDDLTRKAPGADAVMICAYVNQEYDRVHLVLVYHEHERWGAHIPEGCYTSQGWRLVASAQSDPAMASTTDYNDCDGEPHVR